MQQIQHFTQDIGINLAGVAYIFALMDQMELDRNVDAMLRRAEECIREAAARLEE